jgi:RES domain-containing protein
VAIVWRVSHPAFAAQAYSGLGSERAGGRFNSRGRPVAYTSGSLALAVLESLVQAGSRGLLRPYLCVPAEVPDDLIGRLAPLPKNWNAVPYQKASQAAGDSWLLANSELAVRVPSVVIRVESNILINPLHPDFGRVEIGEPIPFPWDARLG